MGGAVGYRTCGRAKLLVYRLTITLIGVEQHSNSSEHLVIATKRAWRVEETKHLVSRFGTEPVKSGTRRGDAFRRKEVKPSDLSFG